MPNAILALNGGSSSLKFGLYEADLSGELRSIARGAIGLGDVRSLTAKGPDGRSLLEKEFPGSGLEDLIGELLRWADSWTGQGLVAAGHRIVHGGNRFSEPVLLTPQVIDEVEKLRPLAPLHQPRSIAPIRALTALRPHLPQVGCFDTAFHGTIEATVRRYALPRRYEAMGIQRYGFHGLSYEYVASRLRQVSPELAAGRTVVGHLGNGASLCALRDGNSVDTTMGFSALDGLVMGTRCGAIDPGVLLYLLQEEGFSPAELQRVLYEGSGLLGVSGISSDVRELSESRDPHAREALELFAFRAARETAALASTMGGLDGLVFTAGIGEHSASIRSAICSRLTWLGARIDQDANESHAERISAVDSPVDVYVIPTDEEVVIARHVLSAVEKV
ncbi:acetate/propionate family kinase [Mesorhizobium xinjiangense]|uniref:acetate/propionate family kinase n=1 Tax=Mesorhizobium xinjiangense TaxID=2678685 RepID=UPI0012EDD49E|nr:acetate/propionate family kinase [Mesorhizobium xinjiangense]